MGYHVEKPFRIPATARDFEGFRRWARSPRFPDWGRIYRLLAPDADGWLRSPLIGPVRLRRERKRPDRWSYRLDVGEA